MGAAEPVAARLTRVSTGHVVMLLAGALGVMLTLSVVRSADHTTPVLVAARDLTPGTVIDAQAVRITRVHVDAAVLATLFAANQLAAAHGQVTTATIRAGAFVTRDIVRPAADRATPRVMSFPIPKARAVDGRLATGDRIDVVAVAHDNGAARYVVTDASVVAVDGRAGNALSGESDDVTITIIVDPASAARLASALDTKVVSLVRATGAPAIGSLK